MRIFAFDRLGLEATGSSYGHPKEHSGSMLSAKALLAALVRINSVNPSLDPSASGETAIADYIAQVVNDCGLVSRWQTVEGDRRNLLVCVPGKHSNKRLLFTAHLDTVPAIGWKEDPFIPRIDGRRLYGRGAADTKASLAAMLVALSSIRRERPEWTIVFAGTVDEEFRKKGAHALARETPGFEAAIVGEPTFLELVVAHKGSVRWSVRTIGRAAHTSLSSLGDNAIVQMARIVSTLAEHDEKLKQKSDPLVGAPSLTVSLVKGGTDICTVPASCEISIDRRLVPGETPEIAVAAVSALLHNLHACRPFGEAPVMGIPTADPPLCAKTNSVLAAVAQYACRKHAKTGAFKGVPYGTDASALATAGIDCIVFGPGTIDQAHTVDEFVDLDQLDPAVAVYREIMLSYR